jgi:hypothetical protein
MKMENHAALGAMNFSRKGNREIRPVMNPYNVALPQPSQERSKDVSNHDTMQGPGKSS